MKQTDFFFSAVVDMVDHPYKGPVKEAAHAVYRACKAINQPKKYGSAIESIIIDAILQDYNSKIHKPSVRYLRKKKAVEAGLLVDLDEMLNSDFLEAVELYKQLIFEVLARIEGRVGEYDFEGLKRDLERAIEEEVKVAE